jgi:hypothetical protein
MLRRLIEFIRRVYTAPVREMQERVALDQFPEERDIRG